MRIGFLGVVTAIGFGCATLGIPSVAAAQAATGPAAAAEVYDGAGNDVGTANLWQAAEGVRVDATLHGVGSGWHAAYIASGGQCDPETFVTAQARFLSISATLRKPSEVQLRNGDLKNLDDPSVGSNFQAVGDTLTLHGLAAGASLGPGGAAILGPTGAAVIIQSQSDSGGQADSQITCGVIVSVGVARDGSTFTSQAAETQAAFRALYGDGAAQAWVSQHDAQTSVAAATDVGPDATPVAPADPVCPAPTSDPRNACELTNHAVVSGAITDVGGMHVYRFSISPPGATVHVRLLNLSTDYDLYLLDDSGNLVDQSAHEGTTPETIDTDLQAGDYFLYVYAGLPVPEKAPYQLLFDVGSNLVEPSST